MQQLVPYCSSEEKVPKPPRVKERERERERERVRDRGGKRIPRDVISPNLAAVPCGNVVFGSLDTGL